MSPNRPRKHSPKKLDIELERPVTRSADEDHQTWFSATEGEKPIPAKPLHLCPCCDYNLTGLTSRRCPECGEDFTLPDARFRAKELGELGRDIRLLRRKNLMLACLGILLGCIALTLPFFAISRKLKADLTYHDIVVTLAWFSTLVPFLFLAFSMRTDCRGLRAVFATGLLMFLWGMTFALLW